MGSIFHRGVIFTQVSGLKPKLIFTQWRGRGSQRYSSLNSALNHPATLLIVDFAAPYFIAPLSWSKSFPGSPREIYTYILQIEKKHEEGKTKKQHRYIIETSSSARRRKVCMHYGSEEEIRRRQPFQLFFTGHYYPPRCRRLSHQQTRLSVYIPSIYRYTDTCAKDEDTQARD